MTRRRSAIQSADIRRGASRTNAREAYCRPTQGDTDTYAIYAAIIDTSLNMFDDSILDDARSSTELQDLILRGLYDVITDCIHRYIGGNENSPHPYEVYLKTGLETYVDTTDALYSILADTFGPEIAAHPDNYKLSEKLAKLKLEHFLIYRNVYFQFDTNIPYFLTQVDIQDNGAVAFRQGFPKHAPIPIGIMSDLKRREDNVRIKDINWTKPLSDIPVLVDAIGCPITLFQDLGPRAWEMYVSRRKNFETTYPLLKSIGPT